MDNPAFRALQKWRAALLMTEPFYGTLSLKLQLVEKEEVDTAATDGIHFFYNFKFIMKLTKHEGIGLTAHEVLHCVLLHHTRRGKRNPKIWNIACDYAINLMLIDSGFILPEGGLIDEQYRGMTAESIYNLIYDEEMAKPDGPSKCPWGEILDSPSEQEGQPCSAAEIQQQESNWQVATAQAAEQAKHRGTLPGGLAKVIKDILQPSVDWREVLWPFFTAVSNEEFTWRRPHRGYISEDEYFPSLHSEACPTIVFVQDSSGSVYDHHLKQCWSEIVAAHGFAKPEKLVVMSCDTQVHVNLIKEFYPDDDLAAHEFTVGGRGGTEVKPAFDYIQEHYPDTEAIIYLTDLEIPNSDFGLEPYCPVLWVCTQKQGTAPWGEVIFMEPEDAHEEAA